MNSGSAAIRERLIQIWTDNPLVNIPVLNPVPLGIAHPLRKEGPLSEAEEMKSLPLMDRMKLGVLSVPTAKSRGFLAEDTQQAAMPVPTETTDEANPALLEDPVAGIAKSALTRYRRLSSLSRSRRICSRAWV